MKITFLLMSRNQAFLTFLCCNSPAGCNFAYFSSTRMGMKFMISTWAERTRTVSKFPFANLVITSFTLAIVLLST